MSLSKSTCCNTNSCLQFLKHTVPFIDIKRRKNRLPKFCYVPATSAAHNRLLFLLQLLTVLMKQTHTVKQSIFFRCLWFHFPIIPLPHCPNNLPGISVKVYATQRNILRSIFVFYCCNFIRGQLSIFSPLKFSF